MRTRVLASLTTVALSGAMFVGVAAPAASAAPPTAAPAAAAAAQAKKQLATFTATYENAPLLLTSGGSEVGSFTGTFTATKFQNTNGVLTVTGKLVGQAVGNGRTETIDRTVTGTVASGKGLTTNAAALAAPACDILNLVLGPLHLNLLGLNVDLNQVVLDITAQPGAGNLLGNLLCAVAGLLDGPSPLNAIVALLNRILGI